MEQGCRYQTGKLLNRPSSLSFFPSLLFSFYVSAASAHILQSLLLVDPPTAAPLLSYLLLHSLTYVYFLLKEENIIIYIFDQPWPELFLYPYGASLAKKYVDTWFINPYLISILKKCEHQCRTNNLDSSVRRPRLGLQISNKSISEGGWSCVIRFAERMSSETVSLLPRIFLTILHNKSLYFSFLRNHYSKRRWKLM